MQMGSTNPIFIYVGIGLLALGGVSGIALFFRAIGGTKDEHDNKATLWGLFIIGVGAGLILVSV